ncbi:MAG: diguanylate cyclase [Firmicutes bacterium]|nr:diguanylate cyclase [Bacillota bacterium]
MRRKDGTNIYVFCYARVYYDSAVRAERSEIIIADFSQTHSARVLLDTERNKAQNRLKYWERTYRRDSLTGLLTHAAFRSDVEQMLLEGTSKLVMLMMDIDKFKEYNDTFGHRNGDELLILIAHTLLATLEESDRACRMGGDKFAAVLVFDRDVEDAVIQERVQNIFTQINLRLKSASVETGISNVGLNYGDFFSAEKNIGDLQTISELAYEGQVITLLPTSLIEEDLADHKLQVIPELDRDLFTNVYILTPPGETSKRELIDGFLSLLCTVLPDAR